MKTATIQDVPNHWPEILKWTAAGEEVQVTDADKVVARILPPPTPVAQPDFVGRAKAIWGDEPAGKLLSTIVSEGRGGGQ